MLLHLAAIVVSVVFLIAGYVFVFKSLDEHFQIQHEINQKLPLDGQFEPTLWGYGAWQKFRQLQNELLPNSPRPRRLRKFQVIGAVLFATGMLFLIVTLRNGV